MKLLFVRSVGFHYDILKEYKGGISLLGYEVKALKNNHASLKGAFLRVYNNEIFLQNLSLFCGESHTKKSYKILLHRREIESIKKNIAGHTLVPLEIFTSRGWIKVRFALARGKKKYDKKQSLKERDVDMNAKRSLKNFV
jgi:SsrA-binding protein